VPGPLPPDVHKLGLEESQHGDAAVLAVSGNVDMGAAPPLADAVGAIFRRKPPVFVIDLTDVNFLATAGMSILMEALRKCQETGIALRVVADGHITARPMQLLGIDVLLDLYPTLDAALRA
jgi:anti-sigma B factor antagonist